VDGRRRVSKWLEDPANRARARATERAGYRRNTEQVRAAKRDAHYLRKYGITRAQRDEMLVAQDGKCLICETSNWGKKGPAVDHCHTTGRVRGLLCGNCNTMIGLAHEDPAILLKAIEYLKRGLDGSAASVVVQRPGVDGGVVAVGVAVD
jgi:hypothetical protein